MSEFHPFTHADVRRKQNRELMLADLERIARETGAEFSVSRNPLYGPRAVSVSLKVEHTAVSLRLDGESRCGAFVGSWHGSRRLDPSFAMDIQGSINPYHGCKGTTVIEDWQPFCHALQNGLAALKTGAVWIEDAS